jgi:lysophospholipase L1-like esterase
VVVLTVGGNDLQTAIAGGDATGALLDNAMRDIRGMIEFFQDTGNFPDGTSIYLANVYDPSDGEAQIPGCFFGLRLPQLVAALDVWSERFSALGMEMGFSVVDTLGAFHGHGHHSDNTMNPYYDTDDPTGWFDDCIHPNNRGHHELRRLIYEAMDPTYRAE